MHTHVVTGGNMFKVLLILLVLRQKARRWLWHKVRSVENRMYRAIDALDAWLCWKFVQVTSVPMTETGVVTAKIRRRRGGFMLTVHVPVFNNYSQAVEASVSRKEFHRLQKGSEVTVRHKYDICADRCRGKLIAVVSYEPVPNWESRKKGMGKKRKKGDDDMSSLCF